MTEAPSSGSFGQPAPLVRPVDATPFGGAHGPGLSGEAARAMRDELYALARARAWTERLLALTEAMSSTTAVPEVAAVATGLACETLGAAASAVFLLTADGGEIEAVHAEGWAHAELAAAPWRRFAVAPGIPVVDAMQRRELLVIESLEEYRARYPLLAPVLEAAGYATDVVVPLEVEGRAIGALNCQFRERRALPVEERDYLTALGRQAAQAIRRARLLAGEREARAEAESARREAEMARAEAEHASRAKSEFLATMSHELRTPLNAIAGYAELLRLGIHGPVTADQTQALERIQRSQRHLLGLINEVLNFARVEAGVVQYAIEEVPMDEVLGTCEALTAPQLRAKRLHYRYSGEDPTLAARADREKVQQVVLNLLSNAVKFTEPGGRVSMECEADEHTVRVRVVDTGRGIPADQLERVFQPFVQVRAEVARPHDGVGLGLAISRDLARGMGGELTVESEPGVGSTFTLTLPRS